MTNYQRTMRNCIIGLVLAIGLWFIGMGSAHAITLIPPSLEIGLKPGTVYNTEIKLYNETAAAIELYTEKVNFGAVGETGRPAFDFNTDTSVGLVSWMDIEEGPITVQPGERYQVPLTIITPANADPGGHYATVFFGTSPPADSQVNISSKVGTLVLARVDGEVIEQGSIAEFGTESGATVYSRLPIELYARFQNAGNVHLKPAGTITFKNMLGQEVDTIEFNAKNGATLPDTIRKYQATWEKAAVVQTTGNSWSNFWEEYKNEKNNFSLGRYTAVLSVTAGSTDSVADSATTSFWVLPWYMISVWGIGVLLVILVLVIGIKKYNSWIVKKSQSLK